MSKENALHINLNEKESGKEEFLIEEVPYSEEQSSIFDKYLRERKFLCALMGGLSGATSADLLISGWHVPCHAIITKSQKGICQVLHVQPNNMSASLLSYEQKRALEAQRGQGVSAITVKGNRAWFGDWDIKEIEGFGIEYQRTIQVETSQWWRLLYDPITNEIWIDIKDKKILKKYKEFQ